MMAHPLKMTTNYDVASIDFKYDYVQNRIKEAIKQAEYLELTHVRRISTHTSPTLRDYFTPTSIQILYEMLNPLIQYNYTVVKAIAHKNDNNTDPHLWKWIAIWLNIVTVSLNIKALTDDYKYPIEYMIYYKKAVDLGDIESAYALAYDIYYSNLFDYSDKSFEYIHKLLESGVTALHIDSVYLKTDIYCNENEPEEAFPLFEILIAHRHEMGIRRFINEICKNHYQFLAELKTRTYDNTLRLRLNDPSPEIATFLATKETGIQGECYVCNGESQKLIYHDCRQITHVLCVICYCKTAASCPQCRFNFKAAKAELIKK